MNIPEQVKTAARNLIEIYGSAFDYLGKYKGKDAYLFHFPDDACAGFQFVYLFKDNEVTEVTGFKALDIVDLLGKNIGKVGVE